MILVRHEQGTPAWKRWRLDGLGGSDVAAVLGLSPFADATRERLLHEKATGAERETNFEMRRGTRLEPVARELYALHADCDVDVVCVEHPDAPWVRVSLDGLCRPRDRGDGPWAPWVLELKCPNWKVHDLALAGLLPAYYRVQVQWQLLATGLDRCDYASFNDGRRFAPADQLAVVTVGADPEEQAALLEAGERFWAEVLAARDASLRPQPA